MDKEQRNEARARLEEREVESTTATQGTTENIIFTAMLKMKENLNLYMDEFYKYICELESDAPDVDYLKRMELQRFKDVMNTYPGGHNINFDKYDSQLANKNGGTPIRVEDTIFSGFTDDDIVNYINHIGQNSTIRVIISPHKTERIDIYKYIFLNTGNGISDDCMPTQMASIKPEGTFMRFLKGFVVATIPRLKIEGSDTRESTLTSVISSRLLKNLDFTADFFSSFQNYLRKYHAGNNGGAIVFHRKPFRIPPNHPKVYKYGLTKKFVDDMLKGGFVTMKRGMSGTYFNVYHRFPLNEGFECNEIWTKYLKYISSNNEELYTSLLRVLSIIIFEKRTGAYARPSICLTGSPGSGKSILSELITYICGVQSTYSLGVSDVNLNDIFTKRQAYNIILTDDADEFQDKRKMFGAILKKDTRSPDGKTTTKHKDGFTRLNLDCHHVITVNLERPLLFDTDDIISDDSCFIWANNLVRSDTAWFKGNPEFTSLVLKYGGRNFDELGVIMKKGAYRFITDVLIDVYNELLDVRKKKHYRFGCPIPVTEEYKSMNLNAINYGHRSDVSDFFESIIRMYVNKSRDVHMQNNSKIRDAVTLAFEDGIFVNALFNDKTVSSVFQRPKPAHIKEFVEKIIAHETVITNEKTGVQESIVNTNKVVIYNGIKSKAVSINSYIWNNYVKDLMNEADLNSETPSVNHLEDDIEDFIVDDELMIKPIITEDKREEYIKQMNAKLNEEQEIMKPRTLKEEIKEDPSLNGFKRNKKRRT